MDVDLSLPRNSSVRRSSNGCWTCRLRRKKCDEKHPVCDTCATLLITCYNGQDRPEWMDGGPRQEEMAQRLKREVRENAHLRLRQWERAVRISPSDGGLADNHSDGVEPRPETSLPRLGTDHTPSPKVCMVPVPFERSDTILLMFYLDHVLPFLFPLYRPSPLEGGKSWILEMAISSMVVRQATLCQASYFFSFAHRTENCEATFQTVLARIRETFEVLRQSLQVINAANIAEHLHGAVRILASIMQVQRFEIALLSLDNCRAHLNGALALFTRLLESGGGGGEEGAEAAAAAATTDPAAGFEAVYNRLGPSPWVMPTMCSQFKSAEQAAFAFSSALLVFDDIIASTALRQRPTLHRYHAGLLGPAPGRDGQPLINLEAAVGCQNWVLRQIGETAALDAWKREQCEADGTPCAAELARRAAPIRAALETRLARLEAECGLAAAEAAEGADLLDVLRPEYWRAAPAPAAQAPLVTRVWAHAALLYLSAVQASGQEEQETARVLLGDYRRRHVGRLLGLLDVPGGGAPPALLRAMVWPFCVAGCVAAEPSLRGWCRRLAARLGGPPAVFGTVLRAREIMERVWADGGGGGGVESWFGRPGEWVLLV